MRGQRAVIDEAVASLVRAIAERLAPLGWVERRVDRHPAGVFARPTRAGVLATAQIGRQGFQFPDEWPATVWLRLGVGHEAVLDLSPLLTLSPIVAVLPNPATIEHGGMEFELAGEADAAATADRVVAAINEHAAAFAEGFSDLDALIEARGSATGSGEGRDWRPDGPPSPEVEVADRLSMVDLALLAAGRHDDTRSLLALFEADHAARGGVEARLSRRFVRQLKRWLDAGSPSVPPAEDTLARLPVPAPITGPSWSEARENARAVRAAGEAARARAKGRSISEIIALLEEEYARRGVDLSPSAIAVRAEQIQLEQQPLGRLRFALRSATVLAGAGRQIGNAFRNTGEDPVWLRPPDRAGFPVTDGGGTRNAVVIIDEAATEFLTRVFDEAPRRAADAVLVEIWFTAGDPARQGSPIAVHIGTHQVGTLPPEYSGDFVGIFNAAAMFDEDPLALATLHHRVGGAWYLEFKLPKVA